MTPSPAVALNFAQLVARPSQSRFSRKKVSTLVPQCIIAFAKIVALWHTLLRASIEALIVFRTCDRVGAVASDLPTHTHFAVCISPHNTTQQCAVYTPKHLQVI